MKTTAILFLLAASVLLAGCAQDPDDRHFYETGWVHPGTRDMDMR